MARIIEQIDSIIDSLTESNGGSSITESDIRDAKDELNELRKLTPIRDIIKIHTEKLNAMKENQSHWDKERWTDTEMRECENMIKILASILSDLNRALE